VRETPAIRVGGDGRYRASPDVGEHVGIEPALQVHRAGHARERHVADPRRIAVMCTSEHSRTGTDTSSSAAAMAASSSVNGAPTCGFRVSFTVS